MHNDLGNSPSQNDLKPAPLPEPGPQAPPPHAPPADIMAPTEAGNTITKAKENMTARHFLKTLVILVWGNVRTNNRPHKKWHWENPATQTNTVRSAFLCFFDLGQRERPVTKSSPVS